MKWTVFLLALIVLVAASAHAVEFGPRSAIITNPYFPARIGDWQFILGVSNNQIHRQVLYLNAFGTESVSGAKINGQVFNNVNCLKVHLVETDDIGDNEHEMLTFNFAQDTDGNVWVMKIHSSMEDMAGLFGGPYFMSVFMPAVPAVGLRASIKMPEDDDNYCRIVEVGIPSLKTTFGTYTDCVKVNCYDEDPTDIDIDYYCRGVGIVRTFNEENTPFVFMDLKDRGTAKLKRGAVVIPMGN